jgi:hypothetical protein
MIVVNRLTRNASAATTVLLERPHLPDQSLGSLYMRAALVARNSSIPTTTTTTRRTFFQMINPRDGQLGTHLV